MSEENKSEAVSGSLSGNLNTPQTIEERQRTLRIAKCLQGEPVCVLNERLAPHSGIGDLRKWATGVLKVFGEKAVNFEIGEIICDERSIKNSFAHGLNPFKVEAVRSIKDVIEQGVVFAQTKVGREKHYFIAAPVVIENKEDIVTILAKRDMNTQRMYLHSVATKESILNKDFSQNKTPETLVPSADTEVSERSGKLYSGDIGRILQNYLKVNIRELEVEINQQIEQQKGNKMAQENENTTNAMQPESHRQQQFVADTMAKYPIKDGEPSIVWSLLWNDDSPNRSIPNLARMSVQAAETIYSRLDEMVAQEKRGYDTVIIGGEEINPESHRGRTGLFGYRFELGRNDGSLLGALAIDNIHHKDLLKLATYLTPETQNRLLERLSQPTADYAYDLTETMLENKKAFAELLQTQIQQQTKQATYSQDNPYAAYAKDDEEVRQNADETYSIEIIGQFKNHGSQDAFESARDFTMTFHQGDEIVHYFYTNQLDKALEQVAEFSKNPAQWIENKDKTVEQHLSDLVDETVAIMQKHSVEVESLDFQFTHKGLADRSATFNQELLKLTPEQLKELQPYFEQHKAIQTLQDLYRQTGDNARLDEMQEHNRLIEWKIHNKVEAYLGKHIDYSDMDYYKGIKTGEELQQMMNERLPENNTVQDSAPAVQGANDGVENRQPETKFGESQNLSGSPEQKQSSVDEPKNFVQKFEENHQNAQNGENLTNNGKNSAEILSESNISHPETFQKQVMFAKIEETEVSKMIDNLAKERTYLAVDIEHKDIAKGAGAKWDKVLRAWYAEKGNLNETLQQFLPQQPEITVQNRKPYSDFMYQARKIGIDLNESNFQEKFDSWVRCPVKGKGKSNRDGGYKLFRNDDGSIGATAKNYSTGDSVGWCDKTQGEKKVAGKVPLADFIANKKQTEWLEIAKNTVEQMVQQMRGNIAQDAYHQLQPALATDPYIQNKGISDIGKLKRLDDGSTIVPLYHNGKIANLQMIPAYDSSKKRLMTQAVKTGAYYSIGNGKNPQTVIIAEGVATADSVHQIATEIYGKDSVLTLSAIDSGSLKAVANKVDKVYPDAQKIIAADNDAHNATRAELKFKNAGLDKANEVQQAYPDFQVALCPALTDEKGSVKNTDWNDFLKAHGTESAIKAFSGSLNGVKQYAPKQHNNAQEHSKNGTDGREH